MTTSDSLIGLLTDDKLDDLWREACRDDWHLNIVGSEIRSLIAEIKRLRTPVPVSCDDEGCPHYNTPHSHGKRKTEQPVGLPTGCDNWQEIIDENAEYERLFDKQHAEIDRLRMRESDWVRIEDHVIHASNEYGRGYADGIKGVDHNQWRPMSTLPKIHGEHCIVGHMDGFSYEAHWSDNDMGLRAYGATVDMEPLTGWMPMPKPLTKTPSIEGQS